MYLEREDAYLEHKIAIFEIYPFFANGSKKRLIFREKRSTLIFYGLCVLCGENRLHVEILYVQRVVLDKLASGFDLVAHQDGEDRVGFDHVFDADL